MAAPRIYCKLIDANRFFDAAFEGYINQCLWTFSKTVFSRSWPCMCGEPQRLYMT